MRYQQAKPATTSIQKVFKKNLKVKKSLGKEFSVSGLSVLSLTLCLMRNFSLKIWLQFLATFFKGWVLTVQNVLDLSVKSKILGLWRKRWVFFISFFLSWLVSWCFRICWIGSATQWWLLSHLSPQLSNSSREWALGPRFESHSGPFSELWIIK